MYIYHHLGLGDHIICNGLVRHYADREKQVKLYCKKQNMKNVSFMYRDISNLELIPISNDDEISKNPQANTLVCGIGIGGEIHNCNWDENFYRNANINFDYSWSKFHINKPNHFNNFNKTNCAFIHRSGSDGIDCIDNKSVNKSLNIIEPTMDINFFDYLHIIENAEEIHCINSAFIHLVDRIHTKGRLFYHKNIVLKPYSDFTLKKNWIVI